MLTDWGSRGGWNWRSLVIVVGLGAAILVASEPPRAPGLALQLFDVVARTFEVFLYTLLTLGLDGVQDCGFTYPLGYCETPTAHFLAPTVVARNILPARCSREQGKIVLSFIHGRKDHQEQVRWGASCSLGPAGRREWRGRRSSARSAWFPGEEMRRREKEKIPDGPARDERRCSSCPVILCS